MNSEAERLQNQGVEQLPASQREGTGIAIEHFSDRDDVLWLELWLAVAEERGGTGIGLSFSRVVVPELVAVHEGLFFWADQETSLVDFWKQIEAEPSQKKALSLGNWATVTES